MPGKTQPSESRRTVYLNRKLAGLCTRCGVTAAEDSNLCPAHRAERNERSAASMQRARDLRRKQKQCIYCGTGTKGYFCTACRIRWNRYRVLWERAGVVNTNVNKRDRLASRTIKHADGRTRYHGQSRRGNQPHGQLDEQDLADAILRLTRAKEGLAMARSESQPLSKQQREAAKRAAFAHADHAIRFVEDAMTRARYQRQVTVVDHEPP